MGSSQKTIQRLRRLYVDALGELLPERILLVGWAGQKKVIHIHREKQALGCKPVAARMSVDWCAT